MFLLGWAERTVTSVEVALFLGTTLSPLHARHGGENQPPAALLDSLAVDLTAGFLRAGAWPAPSRHSWGGQAFHCHVYPSPRVLVLGGGGQFLI